MASSSASAIARALPQHTQMQALVDAVCLRRGVLHPGDENLRLRERGGELGDERDRATHPHVDGIGAPRLAERCPRGVIDQAARLDGIRLADLAAGDADPRAPRGVLLQMGGQRVQVCRGASAAGLLRMLILARARRISVFDALSR